MGRHFVLTLGRSGSNYIVNTINQHPRLLNYGEVLGDWNLIRKFQKLYPLAPQEDAALIDWLLNARAPFYFAQTYRAASKLLRSEILPLKSRSMTASVGVKEFSLNLKKFSIPDYLKERDDVKVVALQRHSVFDRTLSYLMLSRTGVAAMRDTDQKSQGSTFAVEPEYFLKVLSDIESENLFLEDMIAALPPERVFRIEYEDYFADLAHRAEINGKLFEFLEVEPIQAKEMMQKIIKRRPAEIIENFEDCRRAAIGTRFEQLFDGV